MILFVSLYERNFYIIIYFPFYRFFLDSNKTLKEAWGGGGQNII